MGWMEHGCHSPLWPWLYAEQPECENVSSIPLSSFCNFVWNRAKHWICHRNPWPNKPVSSLVIYRMTECQGDRFTFKRYIIKWIKWLCCFKNLLCCFQEFDSFICSVLLQTEQPVLQQSIRNQVVVILDLRFTGNYSRRCCFFSVCHCCELPCDWVMTHLWFWGHCFQWIAAYLQSTRVK